MLQSTCAPAIYRLILDILSKFNLSTRELSSLTYPVYLKINLLSLLLQLFFFEIKNHLSFVISTINLFVVLFLTITNFKLVTELNIENTISDSGDCKDSKYC